MDKKLKIAYILTGIALVGQIYFYGKYVDYFIAPISIVLLLLSILGSIRARLALTGFLLYHCFICLNSILFMLLIVNYLGSAESHTMFKDVLDATLIFAITTPVLFGVTIFLFKSINSNETASRFSEKTPLKLSTILFLILAVWIIASLFFISISDYKEIVEAVEQGMFNLKRFVFSVKFFINSLFLSILYFFVASCLYKKKAIGFVPTILIMTIIFRIETLFSNYRLLEYIGTLSTFKDSFDLEYIKLFDFYFHCIVFPLLAVPLIIFFIFCLKEDTLGIVTAKLKDIRGGKNKTSPTN